MKLLKALEIGKECGLNTVEGAIMNIELHAMNVFDYTKLNDELKEMHSEFKDSGFALNDDVDACINKLQEAK